MGSPETAKYFPCALCPASANILHELLGCIRQSQGSTLVRYYWLHSILSWALTSYYLMCFPLSQNHIWNTPFSRHHDPFGFGFGSYSNFPMTFDALTILRNAMQISCRKIHSSGLVLCFLVILLGLVHVGEEELPSEMSFSCIISRVCNINVTAMLLVQLKVTPKGCLPQKQITNHSLESGRWGDKLQEEGLFT